MQLLQKELFLNKNLTGLTGAQFQLGVCTEKETHTSYPLHEKKPPHRKVAVKSYIYWRWIDKPITFFFIYVNNFFKFILVQIKIKQLDMKIILDSGKIEKRCFSQDKIKLKGKTQRYEHHINLFRWLVQLSSLKDNKKWKINIDNSYYKHIAMVCR